jgi:hypothetical protein
LESYKKPGFKYFFEIPPKLELAMKSKAYVRPKLDLWIYGVLGPYAQIDGYVKLKADPLTDPWWVIRGGVEGLVGVEFKLFKFLKVSYKTDPIILVPEYEIARAPDDEKDQTISDTSARSDDDTSDSSADQPPEPKPPTITPTSRPTATRTDVPTPTPSLTPKPPAYQGTGNVLMVYDDDEVWVINKSPKNLSLIGVVYKRISDQGDITAEFASELWGAVAWQPVNALPPEGCFGVFVEAYTYNQPEECGSIWGYIQASNNTGRGRQFWIPRSGSAEFQVFQNDQLIETCVIAEGICGFDLPQP